MKQDTHRVVLTLACRSVVYVLKTDLVERLGFKGEASRRYCIYAFRLPSSVASVASFTADSAGVSSCAGAFPDSTAVEVDGVDEWASIKAIISSANFSLTPLGSFWSS